MSTFINAYSPTNLHFLLEGLLVTVEISVISIVLSYIIDLTLGTIRYVKIKYVSAIAGVAIDIIRNLPLLLIIFFTYFSFPELDTHAPPFWAAISVLVISESAMLAEIVRGGIQAVPGDQMEGARSNRMTYLQVMCYVITPQTIHMMMPALLSQFVSLVKSALLTTTTTLSELLYHVQIIYSRNTTYMIPTYLIIVVMYFVVCFALSSFIQWLKKKLGEGV